MPPSKPSLRKRKPDVMDLDEMAQDPSLKGMLSFLQVSPEVARERHEARVRMEEAESRESQDETTRVDIPRLVMSHSASQQIESTRVDSRPGEIDRGHESKIVTA